MSITFKFNASVVDEIEKQKGLAIENCLGDTTVNNLTLFIQKAAFDENAGKVGVSRTVAVDMLDKYLADSDKDTLILDIMEALVDTGFLSRQYNMPEMREALTKRAKVIQTAIANKD